MPPSMNKVLNTPSFLTNWKMTDNHWYEKLNSNLYHYTTSVSAMKNIVTNHEFWISKFYAMNDCTDCRYGFNLLINLLESKKDELDESTYKLISDNFAETKRNWYVLSFSKEVNSRFMWEVYAQKHGYCIEIDESIIEDALKCVLLPNCEIAADVVKAKDVNNTNRQFVAHSVIYSKDIQIAMLSDAISIINDQVINHDRIEDIFPSLFALYEVLPFFKDSLFIDEKEYRLLVTVPEKNVEDLQFYREANNKIIPYVKFKFLDLTLYIK